MNSFFTLIEFFAVLEEILRTTVIFIMQTNGKKIMSGVFKKRCNFPKIYFENLQNHVKLNMILIHFILAVHLV